MAKSIDIPENISKTQIVEEFFRHIKNNPEKQQLNNALAAARHLDHDAHDVVNLTQIKPSEKKSEDEETFYRDDREESENDQNDENSADEKSQDEEASEKRFNKKGNVLDIEG